MPNNHSTGEMEMKTKLKIKISTFAAEARIIRREERKWKGIHPMRASLHEHRVVGLRKACRTSSLAYGFLRGRSYNVMENFSYSDPDWSGIEKEALRFGCPYYGTEQEMKQRFAEWLEHAKTCREVYKKVLEDRRSEKEEVAA
jgi:hypothetical protein